MPSNWENVIQAEVDATPEQVWEALATAPGLEGWFSGSIEVQPGAGGTLRSTLADFSDALSLTAWEPPQRVVYRSSEGDDGRFYALEWLVEGRAGGTTTLRCVASGFLPGDDWEAEFESLKTGGAMYFYSLVEYLTYFRGRKALVVDALGPPQADWDHAWQLLTNGLGLNGAVKTGDQVRLSPTGFAPIEGVVFVAGQHVLTVRSRDALYRFLKAGPLGLVSHRFFAIDTDPKRTAQAWQAWLNQLFA